MNWRRTFGLLAILAIMLGTSACRKKKPVLPPTRASAPPITQPEMPPSGPPPPMGVEPARPLPTPGELADNIEPPKIPVKPRTRVTRKTVPAPPPKKEVTQTPPQTQQQGPLTAAVSNRD